MNYKNHVGHIFGTKELFTEGYTRLHVCGYEGNKIIVQDNREKVNKPRKYKLSTNSKGTFFNFQGKRLYVQYNEEAVS